MQIIFLGSQQILVWIWISAYRTGQFNIVEIEIGIEIGFDVAAVHGAGIVTF